MLCVKSGTRAFGEKEMPQGYLSWRWSTHFSPPSSSPWIVFLRAKTLHCTPVTPLLFIAAALLAPILPPSRYRIAFLLSPLSTFIALLTLRPEFHHARTTIPPLQARKLGEQGTRGNCRLLYHRRAGNFTRKSV
ncbi:hypothetical protein C7212DRAFT_292413, partial [Tuber magnatum]